MLHRKILPKPALHSKDFSKYGNGKKKLKPHKQEVQFDDKENQHSLGNTCVQTVDISKKIRKRSPKKIYKIIPNGPQRFHGFPVFKDEELGFQPEYINLLHPIRMDNDVDTDQQQIKSGVARLESFLRQACLQRMYGNQNESNEMQEHWANQQSQIPPQIQ